jgi:hypothetical protein
VGDRACVTRGDEGGRFGDGETSGHDNLIWGRKKRLGGRRMRRQVYKDALGRYEEYTFDERGVNTTTDDDDDDDALRLDELTAVTS